MGNEKYDVVIIGSGMGGLCCGYILSKEGMKVCVLEKNRQLGGSLQIFSRNKVIFDTGIHYIGGLEKGQNLYSYFKYLGLMDKLKLKRMDMDGYDIISFAGDPTEYKHAQGYDNFIRVLSQQFPQEEENIKAYCKKIQDICNFFPLYRISDDDKDLITANFLSIDTKTYLQSVTPNVRLQNVLAGSNPLYAGEADKTPLYVHALVVNSYIESAWKCIDGGSQIATHLTSSIKQMGGTVLNYSEAVKFNFEGEKIKEVVLKNGKTVAGTTFISNIDLAKTLDMIEPGHIRQAYRTRITGLKNSISAFILYVTLKKDSLEYFNHNIYHYHSDDVWESIKIKQELWPQSFAVFPQASSKNSKYADSLIIMAYMNYDELEQWQNTKNIIPDNIEYRGDDYETFKKQKAEKLIEAADKRLPGLKQKISSYYTSTPLTYRDYIGTRDGTLYGIEKDYRDPLKTFITPKTKVPNLLLTGQNLNLHGILGVTVSAVVTCSEIVGSTPKALIQKIKKFLEENP